MNCFTAYDILSDGNYRHKCITPLRAFTGACNHIKDNEYSEIMQIGLTATIIIF